MGTFRKDEPLTAAMVRSFDRMPDRPINTALLDGDLWRIYRCVPEVHYAVNQQARLVGRLEWRIEIDSEEVQSNGTNPGADEILRRVFGADLRGITVNAAIHLQVTGRFYLVRLGPDGSRWKVPTALSVQHEDAERAADGGSRSSDRPLSRTSPIPRRAIRDIMRDDPDARRRGYGTQPHRADHAVITRVDAARSQKVQGILRGHDRTASDR